MQTVSARFLEALTRPHVLARRVDVYAGSALVMGRIPITDGSVSADRGNKIRRTLSLTVADVAMMPRQPTDILAPLGNWLRLYRGIQYTDGTEETVPIGTFQIDSLTGDRDLGPVKISGQSLEAVIAAEPFLTPINVGGYGSCGGAITALINQVLPDAVVNNLASNDPSAATKVWDINSQGSRWDAIEELAAAMGAECYATPDGNFAISDLPNLDTAVPVWDVAAGPGGVMVSATTGMDRTKVRNGWRVTGGNLSDGSPAVSYLAVDSDPASPTRWGGPLGHQLGTQNNNLLISSGQCQVVAGSLLRDSLGVDSAIDMRAVPNPALEPGDCIRAVYADGTKALHIVQSVSIPLTASGDFSLTTYSKQEATS